MKIQQRLSPNRTVGRQGQIPDIIVCHQTGGSFTSAINTVGNRANQVSYHFVVSNRGEVVQAVDIANTAWANGTSATGQRAHHHAAHPAVRARSRNANQYTVSIGFADTGTGTLEPLQFAAAIDVICHIRREVLRLYGLGIPLSRDNIIGHHEITPRTRPNCPGRDFPFDLLLRGLRRRREIEERGQSGNTDHDRHHSTGL